MRKAKTALFAFREAKSPGWTFCDPIKVERLAEMGHELRRPEADYLRDGIYELRASHHRVHYRVLYFFQGKMAVLSHGLVKERKVPERDIELAIKHKTVYADDPEKHTYRE